MRKQVPTLKNALRNAKSTLPFGEYRILYGFGFHSSINNLSITKISFMQEHSVYGWAQEYKLTFLQLPPPPLP